MFVTFWVGSVLLLIHHTANKQMTIYPGSWWIKVRFIAGVGGGMALLATLWLLVQ
jgi:hypothetical protein